MIVALRISVEVDVDAWADEYGVDRNQVRDDVRSWVVETLESAPIPLHQVTQR